jgi:hypothetical protein
MRIPIKFGMKRKMFSFVPSFSACAGRTGVPLPLARVVTDAMVVELVLVPPSSHVSAGWLLRVFEYTCTPLRLFEGMEALWRALLMPGAIGYWIPPERDVERYEAEGCVYTDGRVRWERVGSKQQLC